MPRGEKAKLLSICINSPLNSSTFLAQARQTWLYKNRLRMPHDLVRVISRHRAFGPGRPPFIRQQTFSSASLTSATCQQWTWRDWKSTGSLIKESYLSCRGAGCAGFALTKQRLVGH